jgi:hypothetical protein
VAQPCGDGYAKSRILNHHEACSRRNHLLLLPSVRRKVSERLSCPKFYDHQQIQNIEMTLTKYGYIRRNENSFYYDCSQAPTKLEMSM